MMNFGQSLGLVNGSDNSHHSLRITKQVNGTTQAIDSLHSPRLKPVDQSSTHDLEANDTRIVVIIDPGVDDYQMLAEGVIEGAEVFILDAHRDGVHQITDILQSPQPKILNLKSQIHIVSHGSPGTLYLGNTELSLSTLGYYGQAISTWVTPNSELLLYGCNVAAGDAGDEFVDALYQLTGAFISASTTRIKCQGFRRVATVG